MIHVLTVHWRSPEWIAPQLAYLRRNIQEPLEVHAVLNGIDDPSLWSMFDYAEDTPGSHGDKLNRLAERVADRADPEDTLVFLDSDAFPVRPIDAWLKGILSTCPLVGVQRRENLDDRRPHPSFCATTVGFWRQLGGDWGRDKWTTPGGDVLDDAGTRVMWSLEEQRVEWRPLVRTNTTDMHPLFFGVYGHYIYHHGAGSRAKWSVLDDQKVFSEASLRNPSIGSLLADIRGRPGSARSVRAGDLKVLPAASARSLRQIRKRLLLGSIERTSDRIFRQLVADPDFARALDRSIPSVR